MELYDGLLIGIQTAVSLKGLMFCLVGVIMGTFIGVLPGVGPLATISILLPLTFNTPPQFALIMLSGIYYGAQYGGSTASILLNLPGTATNAVTCLDGYPMAQQGRAGVALFLTKIASFTGSLLGVIMIGGFAPVLASFALQFSAADYFSLMLLGLVAAAMISRGSPLLAISMMLIGLALGLVGVDVNTAEFRFTYGSIELADGIHLVVVATGMFGVSEIIANAGSMSKTHVRKADLKLRAMLPTREDLRRAWRPILRGTAVGTGFGILPGTGSTIASFVAYALETRVSKTPEKFGTGMIEGIVAPESANNAAAQTAFIPTLTLGVPGDAVMALMLGALMIHGIIPGPTLITDHPDIFWGLVVSFLIGNLILVIVNIPLIGVWVRLLSIPYTLLYPSILIFICIGVYSIRNSTFDVFSMLVFGIVGYLMRRLHFQPAPLLLGLVLGPLMEENFRRALLLSRGSMMTFLERPISLVFMIVTALFLVVSFVRYYRSRSPSVGDSAVG